MPAARTPSGSGRDDTRRRAGSCAFHPDQKAALSCVRCQSPICPECVESINGRDYCPECARSHRRSRWKAAGVAFGVFLAFSLAATAGVYRITKRSHPPDDAARLAIQLENDPDNDVLRMQYVGVLTRQENFSEAILQLTRVIERNPRNVFLYERMFRLCMRAKRPEDALAWAERQLQMDPDSARWLTYQGDAYLALGRRQEAEASWLQAYALAASDGELAMKLADLYIQDQRLQDAQAVLSATLERMPSGKLRNLVAHRLSEIRRQLGNAQPPDEP